MDIAKLPASGELYELYSKDSRLSDERKENLCKAYETKVKAFDMFQNK